MFKNLIGKIGESTLTALAEAGISPNRSTADTEPRASLANDFFSIGESEDNEEPSRSTPFQSEFSSVDLSVPDALSPKASRSRRSSTSSIISDASSVRPGSSFHMLASDLESASELDDSFGYQPSSHEQLRDALRKNQQGYHKYKGRYSDLARHYRELERENAKTKKVLTDFQDRCLRREGELKEQCALEQRAKAHLEEILRNDLEEKDHLITTLNTKIQLLKSQAETDVEKATSIGNGPNFDGELIDLSRTSNKNDPGLGDELIYINKQKLQEYELLAVKFQTIQEEMKGLTLEKTEAHQHMIAIGNELSLAKAEISAMKTREGELRLLFSETTQSLQSELETKEEAIHQLTQKILNSSQEKLSSVCDDTHGEDKETNAYGIVKKLEKALHDEQMKISKIKQDFENLQTQTCELKRKLEEVTKHSAALKTVTSTTQNCDHNEVDGLSTFIVQNTELGMENAIASMKTKLPQADHQDLETMWQCWKADYYTEKRVANEKSTLIEAEVKRLTEVLEAAAIDGMVGDTNLKTNQSASNTLFVSEEECQLAGAKVDVIHTLETFTKPKKLNASQSKSDTIDIQQQVLDLRAEQITRNYHITYLTEALEEAQQSNQLYTEVEKLEECKVSVKSELQYLQKQHMDLLEELQLVNQEGELAQKVVEEIIGSEVLLITELEEHKKELDQLNVSNDKIRTEIEKAHETKVLLASELDESLKPISNLREELDQLNVSNDKMRKEIEKANETKVLLASELDESLKPISNLRQELDELNVSNDKMRREIEKANETKVLLASDLDESLKPVSDMRQELDQLNVSNDKIRKQIEITSETKSLLTKELEESLKPVSQLQEELEEFNVSNVKMIKELEITSETNFLLNNEIEECLKAVTQSQEKLKQLNVRNEVLSNELEKSNSLESLLVSKLTEGQKRITNLKDELQPLGIQSLMLKDEIEETLQARLALTTELDEGFDHINNIKEEIADMKRRKDQHEEAKALLATEIENGLKTMEQLKKETEEINLKNTVLKDELKEMYKISALISTKLTEERNQNKNFTDEYQLLSIKNQSLEEEVKRMNQAWESLTSDVMKGEKQNVVLNKLELAEEGNQQMGEEVVKTSENITKEYYSDVKATNSHHVDDIQQVDAKISELQEMHRLKIKQLSNEFEGQLHDRIREVSEAHEREIGLMREQEGNEVIQVRNQLKLYKFAAEQAEKNMKESQSSQEEEMKAKDLEISALQEKCKAIADKYETDLREATKKWRQHSEYELEQLNTSHKEELSALSQEWHSERKSPNGNETTPIGSEQELESTNRVAVAAFESTTSTLEMLQRELVSQKQEMEKLKTKHMSEMVTSCNAEEPKDYTKEYLRNVLFEFMMGKASHNVLVKVLADLVQFDPEQTKKVVEKFEQKPSLLGHLRLL